MFNLYARKCIGNVTTVDGATVTISGIKTVRFVVDENEMKLDCFVMEKMIKSTNVMRYECYSAFARIFIGDD